MLRNDPTNELVSLGFNFVWSQKFSKKENKSWKKLEGAFWRNKIPDFNSFFFCLLLFFFFFFVFFFSCCTPPIVRSKKIQKIERDGKIKGPMWMWEIPSFDHNLCRNQGTRLGLTTILPDEMCFCYLAHISWHAFWTKKTLFLIFLWLQGSNWESCGMIEMITIDLLWQGRKGPIATPHHYMKNNNILVLVLNCIKS